MARELPPAPVSDSPSNDVQDRWPGRPGNVGRRRVHRQPRRRRLLHASSSAAATPTRDCDLERFADARHPRAPLPGAVGDARRPTASTRADWSLGRRAPAGAARPRHRADRRPRPPRQRAAAHQPARPGASPTGLAEFAGAVAERVSRGSSDWTPVNEPLTTARFSALYGLWYPHARDDRSFVVALLNQCRATVLAMAGDPARQSARPAGPDRRPRAAPTAPTALAAVGRLLQRAPLARPGTCSAAASTRRTPLWNYLIAQRRRRRRHCSGSPSHPCPPDVIGVNYYVTSERWLDHRLERYPRPHGGRRTAEFVDIESVRVLATPAPGIASLLAGDLAALRHPDRGDRGAHRCRPRGPAALAARDLARRASGAREPAPTSAPSPSGRCSARSTGTRLLGECRGYYEPGPFDIRAPAPRPTALAALDRRARRRHARRAIRCCRAKAGGAAPDRFIAQAGRAARGRHAARPAIARIVAPATVAPILISGASGTLGRAFATDLRAPQHRLPPARPRRAWTSPTRRRSTPRSRAGSPGRSSTRAATSASTRPRPTPSAACARTPSARRSSPTRAPRAGIRLVTFSSDQVFDGRGDRPWVESDAPAPLNVYGASKAAAERDVLARCTRRDGRAHERLLRSVGPAQLRLSTRSRAGAAASPSALPTTSAISPTYVPDLVNVCLDLLIDGESRPLAPRQRRRRELGRARRARGRRWPASTTSTLQPLPGAALGEVAARPRNGVLASERAALMPTLDDALRASSPSASRRRSRGAGTRRRVPRVAPRAAGA